MVATQNIDTLGQMSTVSLRGETRRRIFFIRQVDFYTEYNQQ